ncbi:MAG: DUF945 family protein [Mariprofundaceae bacterium]
MKKISWGLLSLTLLWLITTFSIGQLSQGYSQNLWHKINQSNAMQIKKISSTNNLFHQVIQSQLTITPPNQAPIILDMTQSFRYGPILWGQNRRWDWGFTDADISITLPSLLQQQIHNTLGQNILLNLTSHIAYDGSQQALLEVQPFTSNATGKRLKFHAMHLSIDCNSSWDKYQARLNWQGLQFDTPTSHIHIGDTQSTFSLQNNAQIWLAKLDHFNGKLDIQQKDKALVLQKTHINSSLSYDDQQRVSILQNIQFDGLQYNQEEFTAGQYQLKLENIPQSLWLKLLELQQQLSAKPAAQHQQLMQSMAFSMFALLPGILNAQPNIEINQLKFKHASGDIEVNIKTSLKGLNGKDMFNLPKIKRQLFADIQVTVPYIFAAKHAPLVLDRLQQQGWAVLEGGQLKSKIQMQQGVLTVNKQAVALPF